MDRAPFLRSTSGCHAISLLRQDFVSFATMQKAVGLGMLLIGRELLVQRLRPEHISLEFGFAVHFTLGKATQGRLGNTTGNYSGFCITLVLRNGLHAHMLCVRFCVVAECQNLPTSRAAAYLEVHGT